MVLSMDRWVGKVAVVTGASSGIGAAIVDALVEHGLKVVGLARRVERIEEKAKKLSGKKGKLYAVKVDITKEDDIVKAFEWTTKNVGPVSILVNNAGVAKEANLADAPTELLKTVLDTNVLGLCIATREAVKIMRENKINGHVVHISSIAGHYCPNFPGINIYTASKHAVRALTETLRQELVRLQTKIKITEVSPGVVDTEMTNPENLSQERKDEFRSMFKNGMLKAEDIADSVVYVLSTPEHVQVVGIARRVERVEETAKKLREKKGSLYPLKADISKEEDILKAFQWTNKNVGPVSILINSAGLTVEGNLTDGKAEDWKAVLNLNLVALSIATREAVKIMRENDINGHIIHLGSVLGHVVPNLPGYNLYPATKHAVRALTETLRQELVRLGTKIKITEVSPGVTSSEFTNQNPRMSEDYKKRYESMPMLNAEDIADGVVYVLSTPEHVQVHELMIKPLGSPL